MSLYFGSHDENAVTWHLPWLDDLGLLKKGEILCEVEGAAYNLDPGALVVTDRAVIFVRRFAVSSGGVIETVELGDIESVNTRERSSIGGVIRALVLERRWRPSDPTWREVANAELGRFQPLLDDDEIVLRAVGAWLGFRPGELVVTNRRLRFFTGGVFTPNRSRVSLPLTDVVSVEVDETNKLPKLSIGADQDVGQGWRLEFELSELGDARTLEALVEDARRAVDTQPRPGGPSVEIVFEHIKGGSERAEQMATTILRQQRFLASSDPPSVAQPEVEETSVDPLPRAHLGRGVARWVNANGGRLYVWGADFSDLFDRMEASIHPPDGVVFVKTHAILEFELYVESGMSWTRPIELDRRWFGLRPGITVSTGLVAGPTV